VYSVVEIAGFQYKVKAGDLLDVQKLDVEAGKKTTFEKVLLVGGDTTVVGKPTVAGAKVVAQVVRHGLGEKVKILKRRPGKYTHRKGHRQPYTCLLITEVSDGKGNTSKVDAKDKLAQKLLK